MRQLAQLAVMVALLCPLAVAAQGPTEDVPGDPTDEVFIREGKLGAGVQLTWPTYGFSAMYDLTDRLSVQGVLGTAGYGVSLTGRGLYRLEPREMFVPYGYGEVGTWTGYLTHTTLNMGAGGGVELDPRRVLEDLEDLPPIYVGLEAGLNVITWSDGISPRIQAGTAFHYRF